MVDWEGFEPPTSAMPRQHSYQLNYQPTPPTDEKITLKTFPQTKPPSPEKSPLRPEIDHSIQKKSGQRGAAPVSWGKTSVKPPLFSCPASTVLSVYIQILYQRSIKPLGFLAKNNAHPIQPRPPSYGKPLQYVKVPIGFFETVISHLVENTIRGNSDG